MQKFENEKEPKNRTKQNNDKKLKLAFVPDISI